MPQSSLPPRHQILIQIVAPFSSRLSRYTDQIIESQVLEIAEMKLLIDDIKRNGERGAAALPARPAEVTPEIEAKARQALE